MTLMNIFAHINNISYKSFRSKLRGILPGEIKKQIFRLTKEDSGQA
jgi:hypothetical protein